LLLSTLKNKQTLLLCGELGNSTLEIGARYPVTGVDPERFSKCSNSSRQIALSGEERSQIRLSVGVAGLQPGSLAHVRKSFFVPVLADVDCGQIRMRARIVWFLFEKCLVLSGARFEIASGCESSRQIISGIRIIRIQGERLAQFSNGFVDLVMRQQNGGKRITRGHVRRLQAHGLGQVRKSFFSPAEKL
jgi:hypothetical protein